MDRDSEETYLNLILKCLKSNLIVNQCCHGQLAVQATDFLVSIHPDGSRSCGSSISLCQSSCRELMNGKRLVGK